MSLTIVDGNHLLCRCVFASTGKSEMWTSQGIFTGGVYMFLNALWRVAEKGPIIVVFDDGPCTWRLEQYPDYKKKEPKKSDEEKTELEIEEAKKTDMKFGKTWQLVKLALNVLGIPAVSCPNWEGDDVILRLAQYMSLGGGNIYVMSDDADYFQMVNHGARDNVIIYRAMKGEYVSKENFRESAKIGKVVLDFDPSYYTLFLSLTGTHNGVPGIKGIGNKTGIKIMQELEEPNTKALLKWAQSGNTKKHKLILENIGIVERNLKLIDMNRIPLTQDDVLRALKVAETRSMYDRESLIEFLKSLEIKTLGKWLTWSNYANTNI